MTLSEIALKIGSPIVVAMIIGGFTFYSHVTTELAVMEANIKNIEKEADENQAEFQSDIKEIKNDIKELLKLYKEQ